MAYIPAHQPVLDLQVATMAVPTATVQNMFSSPFQVVAGIPGRQIIPQFLHARKLSGAYTLNGSTIFQITHGVGGGVGLAAATTGFMDNASDVTAFSFGPGNTVGLYTNYGVINGAGSSIGVGLFVTNNVANLTGSGGALEVTVYFRTVLPDVN